MKKILLSMAALSALSIGAPAAAQYSNGGYQNSNSGYQNRAYTDVNGNVGARIGQLQARIQAGIQSGAISRQEAVTLRQQLRQLRDLERHYAVNGLTGRERADLQLRIRNLRQQIRYAEGGQGSYRNNGYDEDGYGRGQSIGRDRDGYDDRIDRNRDGYDDRDYDRDGRWDDDYQDRGYEDRGYEDRGYEDRSQRGGIGGVIDSVLGRGGLQVGQRASGNLYGVPYEYRSRYRDGNGVYYRSDGRSIYQIDARTQTVIRVFPMGR
jgi:hypothetical protein